MITMVRVELTRIKRPAVLEALRTPQLDVTFEPDFQTVRLGDDGKVWLDTSLYEKPALALSDLLASGMIGHWKAMDMLGMLIGASENRYSVYRLKDKDHKEDGCFNIMDLIPVYHAKRYSYEFLVRLADYSEYDADWEMPMGAEYRMLYDITRNHGVDFFRISGTNLIVIPGTYIYPTRLSEIQIINEF